MIKAEYIDHMGSDLTVVNAARVSFDKESVEFGGSDTRLVQYLARHNHFTPFTHAMITLRETVPIFVARQRFKSMVGFTYNEVSRRYVDDTPEFYVPDEWRERPSKDKKQGSGGVFNGYVFYEWSENQSHRPDKFRHGVDETAQEVYDDHIKSSLHIYEAMIYAGIAPEQARMILPQSMMTSYYVTGSLAAWARAYRLRIAPDSQKEIQDLAKQWDSIIQPLYPESWKALTHP